MASLNASRRVVPVSMIALAVFVLVLGIGFAVRVHQIGVQSFWNDEGNTYVQSLRTIPEIAFHAGRDIHPPGYYVLIAGWRLLAGESEAAYRLFSAFASLVTLACIIAAGRIIGGRGAAGWALGGLATLLLAFNTFSIYYAQEARMYALLALWGAASTVTVLRLIGSPTPRRALVHGAITAAGLWTGYAYPFVMLGQGLWVVIVLLAGIGGKNDGLAASDQRPGLRRLIAYTAANLFAIALFAPWLPTAITQITTWPNTGDPIPAAEAVAVLLRWLAYGITADGLALAIPLIVITFGFVRVREGTPGVLRRLLPLTGAAAPLLVFLVMGLFREANLKHVLPAAGMVALSMANGLVNLWMLATAPERRRWVLRGAALAAGAWLIVGLAGHLPPLYADLAYQRDDYRAIVHTIDRTARPGDAIVLNAPNQAEVFGYYDRTGLPVYGLPVGLGGDDADTRTRLDDLIARYNNLFVVYWGADERDPASIVENTLNAVTFEAGDTWYGDVRLARYSIPQPLTIIQQPVDAVFGGLIALDAYALEADTARPGDMLQVRFTWRAITPLTTRYAMFVQLLDENGILAAQRDSEPGGGATLTVDWPADAPITDNHALVLPADLLPGTYTLIAGLYPLDDPTARLTLPDGSSALTLATISVQ